MRWMSEVVEWMLRRHGTATAVRPHKTLCPLLVHPKNKRSVQDIATVVYSISCKDCPMVYIGETRRWFWTRQLEYKKDYGRFRSEVYKGKEQGISHRDSQVGIDSPCHEQELYYWLGWCAIPSIRTRLEVERCGHKDLTLDNYDRRHIFT